MWYIPSEQDLIDLWFEEYEWQWVFFAETHHTFIYDSFVYEWAVRFSDDPYEIEKAFFPKCKEDVDVFINMLEPVD